MDWLAIIGVILGSQATLEIIKYVATYLSEARKEKNAYKNALENNLNDVREVYLRLEEIITKTNASRASILKITNGGGTPQIDKSMYLTCLYQKCDLTMSNLEDLIRDFRLDHSIVKLTQPLVNNTYHHIETKNLTESFIKDVYVNDNITESVIYKIYRDKNTLVFLMLDYKNDNCSQFGICSNNNNAVEKKLLIQTSVNYLSNLFTKNIRLVRNSK